MMPVLHRAHENTVSLAYSTVRYSIHLTKEIVKVSAATVCLIQLSNRFLIPIDPTMRKTVLYAVVLAPVMEEIAFRGILLRTFERMQWLKNKVLIENKPTELHLKTQEVFRVRVSAVLFGLVHFPNFFSVYQSVYTGFLGLSWGHLAEKYKTISIGILAHGLNNAWVMKLILEFSKSKDLTAQYVLVNLAGIHCLAGLAYIWGTTPDMRDALADKVVTVYASATGVCAKGKHYLQQAKLRLSASAAAA